jgi:hypothetical protein
VTKTVIVPPMLEQLTRRRLLGSGARGGAAVLLGGSAAGVLAAAAHAAPPAAAIGAVGAGDLAYVRMLIGAELLLVDFYTDAVASKHLHGRSLADTRLALINEGEHYSYLAAVVGSTGAVALTAADVNFTYPGGAFFTAASVTKLAATLEQLALGAYLGAAGNITNQVVAAAVSQMTANEAQHLAALSLRVGQPAYHDAFPAPLTIEEASDALAAYTS